MGAKDIIITCDNNISSWKCIYMHFNLVLGALVFKHLQYYCLRFLLFALSKIMNSMQLKTGDLISLSEIVEVLLSLWYT